MRAVVCLIACAARAASAQHVPRGDCAIEAAELRAHLEREARKAHRWNLAWGITFGTAAVGQFALAAAHVNPLGPFDRDYEETLYVGGVKATLGAAARVVMPLRVRIPAPTGDACLDRSTLRAAVTDAGRRERNLFWMTHVGGLAVNAAGAIVLGTRRSWSVGALSFAMGYPVGLLSLYTMPRATWHLARDHDTWSISLAGTF